MRKLVDLTGMKFGRLTVIERGEKPEHIKSGGVYWLCKCECGNTKTIKGYNLKSGATTSCGCSQINDLAGMKFGRLTVIERKESDKRGNVLWLCKCECGNEKVVAGISLKNGKTKSCGCLQIEKLKQLNEEQWQDEDFRKMQSERMKQLNEEQWQDEDFRKMQVEKVKEQWKDEEFRKMQSEKGKELWQDEEFRQKYIQSVSKGGISTISNYLRNLPIIREWRKNTYTRENSKCQLTGKHVHGGNSDVHHLYGFNMIVKDAHDLHNIQIKEIIADYTEEELKLLEEYVTLRHTDTSNAVLLCKEVHKLFHSLYRKGENTPEQFEEFKERYLTGEFKEILK